MRRTPRSGWWNGSLRSLSIPRMWLLLQGHGSEVVPALITGFRFDHVFFTGSLPVGRAIMAMAARHLTPVTLELGGKSPAIVDRRVDLRVAAGRVAWSKFFNAGQTCIATDHAFVHADVLEPFLQELQRSVQRFYGSDPRQSPHFARLVNTRRFNTVKGYLGEGRIHIGGEHDAGERYVAPTVMTEIPPDAALMREEIFGPVLPVIPWREREEVLAFVRRNPQPLAAYIHSKDRSAQQWFTERIPFGGGCINHAMLQFGNPALPFGGVGTSGMGHYHGLLPAHPQSLRPFGPQLVAHQHQVLLVTLQRGRAPFAIHGGEGARCRYPMHAAELLQVVAEMLCRGFGVGPEEIPMETQDGHDAVEYGGAKVHAASGKGAAATGYVISRHGKHSTLQARQAQGPDINGGASYPMANLVAGEWLTEGDGTVNVVLDKYHGTELARLPNATNEQLDRAIGSAVAGMKALRQLDAGRRSAMLEDLARRIEAKSEEFARIIVQEAGKPIGYAKGEVARAITTVRVASMEALRFGGEVTPIDFGGGAGKTAFTKRVPIGVLAAITPFNFPLNLVLHKVAPAMAVGCPVVLKPASATPLSSLLLARLIQDIGWPAEAFHVLVCGREAAENLVKDERVAMMSFTGSDQVGWRLKAVCGKKKVALELGGNAAVIIDEGTDLASAAKAVAMGANLYAGQTCISTPAHLRGAGGVRGVPRSVGEGIPGIEGRRSRGSRGLRGAPS
jgi:acyl-CoA reductase-like NAD-dependent aldehyde dehydrogenase